MRLRDPRDRDVEVDARAGVGRDRAGDLAQHEPVAEEHAGVGALGEPVDQPLRASRGEVAQGAVRRLVGRPGVDDVGLLGHRRVEQGADRLGVVLAVLVHGDDPLAAGRGDAGQGRRVLAEVAAQPDRAHPVVGRGEGADGVVGGVGAAVVHEDDLGDPVVAPRRGDPVGDRGGDLLDDRPQGAFALVDGDDDRDQVRRGCRALRLHAAHPIRHARRAGATRGRAARRAGPGRCGRPPRTRRPTKVVSVPW